MSIKKIALAVGVAAIIGLGTAGCVSGGGDYVQNGGEAFSKNVSTDGGEVTCIFWVPAQNGVYNSAGAQMSRDWANAR